MLPRLLIAAAIFAIVGFSCGYFGPLYLLADAGVGPVTGFFMAPLGAALGMAFTVWAGGKRYRAGAFGVRLGIAAAVFAVAVLAIVVTQ